jgi:4-amino-4-deoxy-L-arabinose transferase-like glycosyltransferase
VAVIAILLLVTAVTLAAPLLGRLAYRFDEGVYIAQARLIASGEIPHRDFFLHQPALYPATLAALVWGNPSSLTPYRLVSLVVTAITAWLVFLLARRALSDGAGLAALALFLFHPLQYFGLIAYPNALMVLLAVAGFCLAIFPGSRRHVALAGVCLALSVLFKPVSLSTVLAVVLALLLSRQGRRRLPVLLGSLAGAGLGVTLVLTWISRGGFAQLLHLQVLRLFKGGGFEIMQGMERFQGIMDGAGVSSSLAWNLSRLRIAFLSATDA